MAATKIIAFAVTVLLHACLGNIRADDAKTPAEVAWEDLVGKVPSCMNALSYPPLKQKGAAVDPVYGYSKIRVSRLTSPNTAKLTISFFLPSSDPKQPDEEYGTITLYFSWHKSAWTSTKHEGSSRFTTGIPGDTLLKLIASIDDLSK